ncbi:MAG: hypothetical protein H6510_09750 [Acidobacteria bacterium]|nr:hypothetical protein [Acidobacteriota bacterium]MCB9398090.1 hypothetical protein [Acidobacteriota bacterium]
MRKHLMCLGAAIFLCQCSQQVDQNKALFNHIPNNPELVAMVNPNELAEFSQKAFTELALKDLMDTKWAFQAQDWEHYRVLATSLMEALGLPWSEIQSTGIMIYLEQPVILASGSFRKSEVEQKILDLGFTQNNDGTFNYVYEEQKLFIPADGVLMMAKREILSFLKTIEPQDRLWNRPDFEQYRKTTPLNNSVFIWSAPPEHMFTEFPYRQDLGSVSLALNLKGQISGKAVARLNSPERTIMLYDIIFGSVKVAQGVFGSDQDYSKLFNAISVNHDNTKVEATLVMSHEDAIKLKERMVKDIQNPDDMTIQGFDKFFNMLK